MCNRFATTMVPCANCGTLAPTTRLFDVGGRKICIPCLNNTYIIRPKPKDLDRRSKRRIILD
jgi:hypothetical protein